MPASRSALEETLSFIGNAAKGVGDFVGKTSQGISNTFGNLSKDFQNYSNNYKTGDINGRPIAGGLAGQILQKMPQLPTPKIGTTYYNTMNWLAPRQQAISDWINPDKDVNYFSGFTPANLGEEILRMGKTTLLGTPEQRAISKQGEAIFQKLKAENPNMIALPDPITGNVKVYPSWSAGKNQAIDLTSKLSSQEIADLNQYGKQQSDFITNAAMGATAPMQTTTAKLTTTQLKPAIQALVDKAFSLGKNSDAVIGNLNSLVNTALGGSKPNISALKVLRAYLNKRRFDVAGIDTGNFKTDFKFLQQAKKDAQVGPIIEAIEFHLGNLDDVIKGKKTNVIPTGKVAAVPETPLQTQMAPEMPQQTFQAIKQQGGVTMNVEGTKPVKGYAFSPYKGVETVIPETEFTPQHVEDFTNKNLALLQEEGNYIGGWVEDGKVYLDISKVGDPGWDTMKLAFDNKQEAIYNLETGETLYTPHSTNYNAQTDIYVTNWGQNTRTNQAGGITSPPKNNAPNVQEASTQTGLVESTPQIPTDQELAMKALNESRGYTPETPAVITETVPARGTATRMDELTRYQNEFKQQINQIDEILKNYDIYSSINKTQGGAPVMSKKELLVSKKEIQTTLTKIDQELQSLSKQVVEKPVQPITPSNEELAMQRLQEQQNNRLADLGETPPTSLTDEELAMNQLKAQQEARAQAFEEPTVPPQTPEAPEVPPQSEVPGFEFAPGATDGKVPPTETPQIKSNWFNRLFFPLKNMTPDIQVAATKLEGSYNVAQSRADELAGIFDDAVRKNGINDEIQWKLVKYSQDPSAETAARLGLSPEDLAKADDILEQNRKFNDELFDRARREGIDLNYLQNHILQAWKENLEQVDEVMRAKGLSQTPGFAKERLIPSFEAGETLGLTPKYTTFGQLNALAQHELDKAIANKQFFDDLINSRQILPANAKDIPASWQSVKAPYFPQAFSKGQQVQYKAPAQLAELLNNYFGGIPKGWAGKLVHATGKLSSFLQDIALSGGVGPLNFFGVGNLLKEEAKAIGDLATGHPIRATMQMFKPLMSFFRAYIPGAAKAYEKANSQYIQEMSSQGIKPRGLIHYQSAYKNVVNNGSLGEVLGRGWNKLVNEPTFGKFINQLQIDFYKNMRSAYLKQGMATQEAIEMAGKATKKMYGIGDSMGRAEEVNDMVTTVFLAPKYREAMTNIFADMAQAFKPGNWSKKEYEGLRALSVGVALTYGMYNLMQIKLTGKPMWDNPPGKEFELVAPVGDPKDGAYVSTPFMPGFTAYPRRIAGTATSLIRGDIDEAKKQFGGLFSIPLSKGMELWANRDYFGNKIYGSGTEVSDVAYYLTKSFFPGYVRGATDAATGKSTPTMGLIQALELPIRTGRYPNQFFTAQTDLMKQLPQGKQVLAQFLTTSQAKGGPDSDGRAQAMLADPDLFQFYKKLQLATEPNHPLYSRSDEDIKAYLAYQLLDDNTQKKAELRVVNPWIPQVQAGIGEMITQSQMEKIVPTAGYNPESLSGKVAGALITPPASQVENNRKAAVLALMQQGVNDPVQITNTLNAQGLQTGAGQSIFTADEVAEYLKEIPQNKPADPMSLLSEDQVRVVSAYTAAPKGSITRKQLLAKNPWLKSFWDLRSAYFEKYPITPADSPLNKYLASIGVSPVGGGESSGGGFSFPKKSSKIKIPKIKTAKVNLKGGSIKVKPITPLKLQKKTVPKAPKTAKVKSYTPKKITLKLKKGLPANLARLIS